MAASINCLVCFASVLIIRALLLWSLYVAPELWETPKDRTSLVRVVVEVKDLRIRSPSPARTLDVALPSLGSNF